MLFRSGVGAHAQVGERLHILLPANVAVAGHVRRVRSGSVSTALAIPEGSRMGEVVPHGGSFPVPVPGPLRLVSGGASAPEEAWREGPVEEHLALVSDVPAGGMQPLSPALPQETSSPNPHTRRQQEGETGEGGGARRTNPHVAAGWKDYSTSTGLRHPEEEEG